MTLWKGGGGGDICCCPEHSAPLTAKARSRTKKIKQLDCKFQAVMPLYIYVLRGQESQGGDL